MYTDIFGSLKFILYNLCECIIAPFSVHNYRQQFLGISSPLGRILANRLMETFRPSKYYFFAY